MATPGAIRSPNPPRIDLHSHSFLSDGSESPTGMWRVAETIEHRALAITDHVSLEDPKPVLDRLHREATAWEGSKFRPVVGVELTYVPPRRIADAARGARRAGAEIVIVHGESLVERTPEGTNRAAIDSGEVDVLAHPGLIEPADVELAKAHSVILELSGREGHSLTNGHVAALALARGVPLVVDSDAHRSSQLIPPARAREIARGAGLPAAEVEKALGETPAGLLRRLAGA